jgi:hypothetical protein
MTPDGLPIDRVQGYPTIKTMARGRMQEYQGARTLAALKQAGLALLSSRALKTLSTPAQVTPTLTHAMLEYTSS